MRFYLNFTKIFECLFSFLLFKIKKKKTHITKVILLVRCIILTDFIQKVVSEVQDGPNTAEGEQHEVNNLYPLLMQHNGAMESWNKGNNNTNIMPINQVKDLREAVLKLEAADRFRSQGFLRSEQNLPKANKRGV
uniref:Urotensin-related peptide 1 n=1 Tax=Cyclopterus lumpus TaxID=8103 RepID=A0A8C2WUP5_CYCLU